MTVDSEGILLIHLYLREKKNMLRLSSNEITKSKQI